MFEKDPMLWRKLVHPDDADYVDSLDYSRPVPVKAEFRIIRKDGETRWVAVSVYPQFDQHGVPVRFEGITVDITEHKEFQRKLREFAYTDFLTNLPNRHKFDMDFALAIEEARVSGKQVGLLYIDFDRFKYINDTFGHHAGDFALQQIANKFQCTLPKTANIYRMGGDEFTVLIRNVEDEHALEILAASILNQNDALLFGKEEVPLHYSIGIALYPISGENTDLLLRASDMADYCICAHSPVLPRRPVLL
jgi:diguanylate cyclase (GGDEF)-like protein